MSAYHRHYESLEAAEAAGEKDGASESWAGNSTRLYVCNDCDGVWAVVVNEYGTPWTGWPECPVQAKREEDRACRGC